jgi:serine/threonine protein phosphatase PrpC
MAWKYIEPISEDFIPVIHKFQDQYVTAICASICGWRPTQEDAHIMRSGYFAILDGHGGHDTSKIAAEKLDMNNLMQQIYRSEPIKGEKALLDLSAYVKDFDQAIKNRYLDFDERLKKMIKDYSGSCIISIIFKNDLLYCANIGDSRAIISIKNTIKPLSFDHKPYNSIETKRIESAGGTVHYGRVDCKLAVSRALGDFVYKQNSELANIKQKVSAEAEIIIEELTSDVDFIVLGCDGIFDVMPNDEVGEFIRIRLIEEKPIDQICKEIISYCLFKNSRDNMTIMIIIPKNLKPWKTYNLEKSEMQRIFTSQ